MKRVYLYLFLFICSIQVVFSQTVDSIKVEKSGDFIKIGYRILNSTPRQVFRVTVLFSLEGGLNQEPKTISGDVGDYVMGGKSEYWALWDVLKDVSEIKSVEFIVRAELIKDLDALSNQGTLTSEKPKFWSMKRFHALLCLESPGPRMGIRVGYMGNFGITASFIYGKIPITDVYKNNQYYTDPISSIAVGLSLTKRIINRDKFQFHLLAGFKNNDLLVYFAGPPSPQFWRQGMSSIETGMSFVFNKVVTNIMYSHIGQKQVSQHGEDVVMASPFNYVNIGIGLKF